MPYEIDPYPPFIYKIVGSLLKDTDWVSFIPRLLVLAAAIVTCLLAAILIHHWDKAVDGVALIFACFPSP